MNAHSVEIDEVMLGCQILQSFHLIFNFYLTLLEEGYLLLLFLLVLDKSRILRVSRSASRRITTYYLGSGNTLESLLFQARYKHRTKE